MVLHSPTRVQVREVGQVMTPEEFIKQFKQLCQDWQEAYDEWSTTSTWRWRKRANAHERMNEANRKLEHLGSKGKADQIVRQIENHERNKKMARELFG